MGVTVNEIARICGVSRTTVLRALNNQSRVSDKTRRQVLEVAKELGYRPNLLARSLNTGRTMTLGIVAINMDSLIFVQTLSAINTEAQRKGYSLNIALHGQSSEAEMQRIRDFTDRRMEGILLSPISKGPEFERFVLSLGIPVVCIGNHVSEKISTVMIDEEPGIHRPAPDHGFHQRRKRRRGRRQRADLPDRGRPRRGEKNRPPAQNPRYGNALRQKNRRPLPGNVGERPPCVIRGRGSC